VHTGPVASLKRLSPANTLVETDETLSPLPLTTREELTAFYSEKYREARGVDRMAHLGLKLSRAYYTRHFHAFVMGHPGVGKSTEISKLLLQESNRFLQIRISAAAEMYPGDFRIHDLLWLMTVRVLEAARTPTISGFSDDLSLSLLDAVKHELSERWVEILGLSQREVEGGLDLKLIARIKATLKLSRKRTEKIAEYSFSAVSDLVQVVNRVFNECNEYLRKQKHQEWILAVEDFEKLGVDPEQLRQLFIDNALLFEQLQVHLLFVIPVGLTYTEEAERMPFGRDSQFIVPDIAVFTRSHEVDEKGVDALLEVIYRRVSKELLEKDLARQLALASGGNIRDLFDLFRRAILSAEVRGQTSIQLNYAMEAVNAMRQDYAARLGENPFDKVASIPLEAKLAKLEAIYNGDPQAQFPDKVLYVLLRQRIVLQFNGAGWYGVHPLIVDKLKEISSSIKPDSLGGTPFHVK
jgi:hypothetical protein